jgi:hypothetical protein
MVTSSARLEAGPSSPAVLSADQFVLPLPQFARSFGQRVWRLGWLLGAGASVMSNVPSAGDLIRQFRHLIYCTETNQATQDVDERDPHVQERIAGWFRERDGLPQPGDEDEYAALFELAYPSAGDRAALIRGLVASARPNYGHHVMAALMAVDRLRVVWTTNFDDLPEQAARSLLDSHLVEPRRPLVVADLGDPEPAVRALHDESWPVVGKLHGDIRSDRLKNTNAELQHQDARMRQALLESCRRFGLVVVGYSGRDASVMTSLTEALDAPEPYPAGLYWCQQPGNTPAPVVLDLLTTARQRGVDAHIVVADNFIELMATLEKVTTWPTNIRRSLSDRRPSTPPVRTPPPPLGQRDTWPAIRFNALPMLSLPTEGRLLRTALSPGGQTDPPRVPATQIADVSAALRRNHARGLVAARRGGQLVALGDCESIQAAVQELGLIMTSDLVPLSLGADNANIDPADIGLAHDALAIAFGRTAGLRRVLRAQGEHLVRVDNPDHPSLRSLRSAAGGALAGTVRGTPLRWAEAVALSLDRRDGQWWLLLTPDIWVAPRPDPSGLDRFGITPEGIAEQKRRAKEFVRNRTATRYNRTTAALLDAWVRLLTTGGNRQVRAWNLPAGAGVDAVFTVGGTTAWSRPLRGEADNHAEETSGQPRASDSAFGQDVA